jgi:hypothetical protein
MYISDFKPAPTSPHLQLELVIRTPCMGLSAGFRLPAAAAALDHRIVTRYRFASRRIYDYHRSPSSCREVRSTNKTITAPLLVS